MAAGHVTSEIYQQTVGIVANHRSKTFKSGEYFLRARTTGRILKSRIGKSIHLHEEKRGKIPRKQLWLTFCAAENKFAAH